MDLEIQSRNVEMTPRWKTEIEARIEDLRRGHDDLTHGRVTLTKNRHHKQQDHVAEALVVVTFPGRQTLTARKEEKTFEEAIRSAFEAVTIELGKFRDKRAETEVRLPPVPPNYVHRVLAARHPCSVRKQEVPRWQSQVARRD